MSFSTPWKLIKYPLLKYLLYLNILNLIIKVLKKYYKIVVPMVLGKKLLLMMKWKKYSEESLLNKIKWNLLKLILKPISKLKCPYFMMMTINLMNNKANQLNQLNLKNRKNLYNNPLLYNLLQQTNPKKFKLQWIL